MHLTIRICLILIAGICAQKNYAQSNIKEFFYEEKSDSGYYRLHKFSNGDILKVGIFSRGTYFQLSRLNQDLSEVIWSKIYKINNLECDFDLSEYNHKDQFLLPGLVYIDNRDLLWLRLDSYLTTTKSEIHHYVLLNPDGDLIWQRGYHTCDRGFFQNDGRLTDTNDGVNIYYNNLQSSSYSHDTLRLVTLDISGNAILKTIYTHAKQHVFDHTHYNQIVPNPGEDIILEMNHFSVTPQGSFFNLFYPESKQHVSFKVDRLKYGFLSSINGAVQWLNNEEFVFFTSIIDTIINGNINASMLIGRANINGNVLWSKATDLSNSFFYFNTFTNVAIEAVLIDADKMTIPLCGENGVGSGFLTLDIESGEVLESNFWYYNGMNPGNAGLLRSGKDIYIINYTTNWAAITYDYHPPFIMHDDLNNPSSCIKLPACDFELNDFPLEFILEERPLTVIRKDSVIESRCNLQIEILPAQLEWREICPDVVQQPDAFFTLNSDTICQRELVPVVVLYDHQYFFYKWTLNGQVVEPVSANNDTFYFDFDLEGEAELRLVTSRLGCESEYSVNFFLKGGAEVESISDTIKCVNESIFLPLIEKEGFIIQWENGNNILQVDTPGVYNFTSVNIETGCAFSKSVSVQDQHIPYVDVDSFYSFCREDLARYILPEKSFEVLSLQWIYPAQAGNLQVFAEKTDTYLLRVEGEVCVDTIKVEVEVLSCIGPCDIFIPEAFSPNDDGINDYFEIFLGCKKGILTFRMEIFDRWGNMVFQSNESEFQWDGNIEGKLAPAGAYSYKLKMTLESENEFEEVLREGFVGLVR